METTPATTEIPRADQTPAQEDFAQVRLYHQLARLSAAQAVTFMVLCGRELIKLQEKFDITPGGNRKSLDSNGKSKGHCGPLIWEDLVLQCTGIPKRTATRYIALAKAASSRIPEMLDIPLLNTPLAQLPAPDQDRLIRAVQRVTDGRTAKELMTDWGISRPDRPPGGFRPSDQAVAAWLQQTHPDLADTQYLDLPAAVQKQFRAALKTGAATRGTPKRSQADIERQNLADQSAAWFPLIKAALELGIDHKLYLPLTDRDLQTIETLAQELRLAVKDLLASRNKHQSHNSHNSHNSHP